MNPETKRFLQRQLVWLGIAIAVSLAISFLLPFPYDLLSIVAVFISINFFRHRQMKKMGMSGWSLFGSPSGFAQQKGIDYYCMSCGTKHNQASCPNCGSRLKKAGF